MVAMGLWAAVGVAALAAVWHGGLLFPQPPSPADADVGLVADSFRSYTEAHANLSIWSQGALRRDRFGRPCPALPCACNCRGRARTCALRANPRRRRLWLSISRGAGAMAD